MKIKEYIAFLKQRPITQAFSKQLHERDKSKEADWERHEDLGFLVLARNLAHSALCDFKALSPMLERE